MAFCKCSVVVQLWQSKRKWQGAKHRVQHHATSYPIKIDILRSMRPFTIQRRKLFRGYSKMVATRFEYPDYRREGISSLSETRQQKLLFTSGIQLCFRYTVFQKVPLRKLRELVITETAHKKFPFPRVESMAGEPNWCSRQF